LIGAEAVEDMTFTRLERLVQDMKAKGYQPATVKRKLAMLARALKMATMWTDEKGQPLLRYKPPLPFIKVENLKERIITPTEESTLFAALEKRRQLEPGRQWFAFRVFLTVVWDTGGRLSEVLGLGPKHITAHPKARSVTSPSRATAPRAASRGRCPWPAVRLPHSVR
jgi:site-specific recombinase XerD